MRLLLLLLLLWLRLLVSSAEAIVIIVDASATRVRCLGQKGRDGRLLPPTLRRASVIANRNEQRTDVFAVLTALRVGGASASAFDSVGREFHADRVRLTVVATDGAAGPHVGRGHVIHNTSSEILQAAQKRARAKEATEAAVTESG